MSLKSPIQKAIDAAFSPPISREDIMRAQVKTRAQIPTAYHPNLNHLMVIPLDEQDVSEGGIHLPNQSRIVYNEGHVVERGPQCVGKIMPGDCTMWNPHTQVVMNIEGVRFILVPETQILMYIPKHELEELRKKIEKQSMGTMTDEERIMKFPGEHLSPA